MMKLKTQKAVTRASIRLMTLMDCAPVDDDPYTCATHDVNVVHSEYQWPETGFMWGLCAEVDLLATAAVDAALPELE